MQNAALIWLTDVFSRKLDSHIQALVISTFTRIRNTLPISSAIAAGITDRHLSLGRGCKIDDWHRLSKRAGPTK